MPARQKPRKNSYSRAEMAPDPADKAARQSQEAVEKAKEAAKEAARAITAGSWRGERKTVYAWDIPGDPGYTLHIEITDASSIDEARESALGYEPEGRELSPVERQWIRSTDPNVVRATETVTLAHDQALSENERLSDENAAFRMTRKLFASLGINPYNAQAWVDRVNAEAESKIAQADEERDHRHKVLAGKLTDAIRALEEVRELTGFAPPKPVPPPEPDYAKLGILYDENYINPLDYPRLACANWVTVAPSEPLTSEEVFGFRLLLGIDCAGLLDHASMRASFKEANALRAVAKRMKALVHAEIAARKID